MKCRILLCSETAILDYSTRRLSAINILQDSSINMFPYFTSVFAYFTMEKELNEEVMDADLEVKMNDTVLSVNKIKLNFSTGNKLGSIVGLGLITIPSEGTLAISVIYKDQVLNQYSVNYNKSDKPIWQGGVVPPLGNF